MEAARSNAFSLYELQVVRIENGTLQIRNKAQDERALRDVCRGEGNKDKLMNRSLSLSLCLPDRPTDRNRDRWILRRARVRSGSTQLTPLAAAATIADSILTNLCGQEGNGRGGRDDQRMTLINRSA